MNKLNFSLKSDENNYNYPQYIKSNESKSPYPAGYASSPFTDEASKAALLHTVNPNTFLSFICN